MSLLEESVETKMAGARPHNLPQGPRETTLAKLDALLTEFWRKLEERQQTASKLDHSPPAADMKSRNQPASKAQEAHRQEASTRRPHAVWVCRSSVATHALARTKKRRTVHRRSAVPAKPTHRQCLIKLQATRRTTAAWQIVRRLAGCHQLAMAEPYRHRHTSHPLRDHAHHKERHQGRGLLSQVMIDAIPQACTYLSSPGTDKIPTEGHRVVVNASHHIRPHTAVHTLTRLKWLHHSLILNTSG
ncbi:Hypothetical predicted protein [Pelobates cultripes]|uniref:Uncharacterized protein n=1 Tax=Pelobates cultripes TaxID=61616 RepID=A0AAD1RZ88_PELCU|nr:Hypothetical predicted protein [Pelobates cultripes]